MTPVIKSIPLETASIRRQRALGIPSTDYSLLWGDITSGIRNADRAAHRGQSLLRRAHNNFWFFFWGFLAGAAAGTGLFLYH
jgi:hypothetical protein